MPHNFTELSSILTNSQNVSPMLVWKQLCAKQLEAMDQQAAITPFFANATVTNRQIVKTFTLADEKTELNSTFKESLATKPTGDLAERLNLFLSCYPEYRQELDEKIIMPPATLYPLPDFNADFEKVISTFKALLAKGSIDKFFMELYTIVFYMEMVIEKFDRDQLLEIFNLCIELSAMLYKDRTQFNKFLIEIFKRLSAEDQSALIRDIVPKIVLVPYDDCVTSLLQSLKCNSADDHYIVNYLIGLTTNGDYYQYEKALIMLMHIFKRIPATLMSQALKSICAHLQNQDANIRILVMRNLGRIAEDIPNEYGKEVVELVLQNLQGLKDLGNSIHTLGKLARFIPAESHEDIISILAVEMNHEDEFIHASAANALLSLVVHTDLDKNRQRALEELMEFAARDNSFVKIVNTHLASSSAGIKNALALRLLKGLDNPHYRIDALRQLNYFSNICLHSTRTKIVTKMFDLIEDKDTNVVAQSLVFLFREWKQLAPINQRDFDEAILPLVNFEKEGMQGESVDKLREVVISIVAELTAISPIINENEVYIELRKALYDDNLTIRFRATFALCNIFSFLSVEMQESVIAHLEYFIVNPVIEADDQSALLNKLQELKIKIPYIYQTKIIPVMLLKIVGSALNPLTPTEDRIICLNVFTKLAQNEDPNLVSKHTNALLLLLQSKDMETYLQTLEILCYLFKFITNDQLTDIVGNIATKLVETKDINQMGILIDATLKIASVIAANSPDQLEDLTNVVVAIMVEANPKTNDGVMMKCKMLKFLGDIFNRLPVQSKSLVGDAIIAEMRNPAWPVSMTLAVVTKQIVKEVSLTQRLLILDKLLENLAFFNIDQSALFQYATLISEDSAVIWDVKLNIFNYLLIKMSDNTIRDHVKDILTAYVNNATPAEKNYFVYGLMMQRILKPEIDIIEKYALISAVEQITQNARLQLTIGNALPRNIVGIVAEYIPLRKSYS